MSNLVVSMQKVGVSGLWVMELANTKPDYRSLRRGCNINKFSVACLTNCHRIANISSTNWRLSHLCKLQK